MATTADVVVIGAGIMGISAAYYLAQRGVGKVVVLERAEVCAGATGSSGGGIRHQFSDPVGIELTRRSLKFFESYQDEFGTELAIERCGYLYIIQTAGQLAAFTKNVEVQQGLGLQVELLQPDEIGRRFPYLSLDGVLAGTYCPEDCSSFPREATEIMAQRVAQMGVAIETGQEVLAIRREGGRVVGVRTNSGELDAPVVLIAAGPWAGEVGKLAGVEIPVVPRRREQFTTAPFPTTDVPETPYILDPRGGFSLRREGTGLVFGTTLSIPPTFDTTPNPSAGPDLRAKVALRCPTIANAPIAHAMAGLLEVTPDHNGIIGPAPDLSGLYVLAGFSGHGFMHAPAAGQAMAELIAEGTTAGLDLSGFALDRFIHGDGQVDPTSPFGGGGHEPD